MALIKAVRTRAVPPCLLERVELRNIPFNDSHFNLLADLLLDHDVKRWAGRTRQNLLHLDLRGVCTLFGFYVLSLLE
jgi:hypothetical protein